jgi:hypothetical protein
MSRNISSIDGVVPPGATVILASWQSGPGPGRGATINGSRVPSSGDNNIAHYVRLKLQIRRGGVVRFEDCAWPAVGFVRRVIAEEVTVSAFGSQTLGAHAPFRLGASIQDGVLPENYVVAIGAGATAGPTVGNAIYAPTGARAFRACVPQTMVTPPGAYTANFASLLDGGIPSAGDAVQLSPDWQMWPPWYSVLQLAAASPVLAIEFLI